MDNTNFNSDITILIQGKLEKEAIDFYEKNYKHYNVIISTWIDYNITAVCEKHFNIIKSEYPPANGPQNYFYKVVSTLNGLNQVKTKYCLIIRGDEYFSNIDYVVDSVVNNESRIATIPVFLNSFNVHRYHIGDHLYAGKIENLKIMFQEAYNKIEKYNWDTNILSSEQGLTRAYLERKEAELSVWENYRNWNYLINDIEKNINGPDIMKKHFYTLNLEKLKPFLIAVNVAKKKYYDVSNEIIGIYSVDDV